MQLVLVDLKEYGDFSMDGLCADILKKHQDTIRTRKPHVAVAKLGKIVDTILHLSNKQGFHATSLREISTGSGVSMGGLYSYFDSKDTLLIMILGQVASSVTKVLENPPENVTEDPLKHLGWLVSAHVALTEAMLPWFVFSFMEAKSFPQEGKSMAIESEKATEKLFSNVLKRGVDAGTFKIENPDFVAALLKPLLQDWYVKRSKWRRRGLTASEYSEGLCNFLEAALKVDPATMALPAAPAEQTEE